MYVFDMTLFRNFDSRPKELRYVVLNRELETISFWLACDKFSLNVSKTNKINFPELLISANAKCNYHIDHVFRKVSRVVGVLNTLTKINPLIILVTLYNYLAFCSIVCWYGQLVQILINYFFSRTKY